MRSIPAAMTWELLARNRWTLAASALGAIAFPVVLLAALEQEGALFPQDSCMLIMHMVLAPLSMTMFGSALVASHWRISRLYAYPATTAAIVAWRLLPAMATIYVQTVAWAMAINAMFELNWPLWGPALFAAVGLAAVEAAIWLTDRSSWVLVAMAAVGAPLGLWFKMHYGPIRSDPVSTWTPLGALEAVALLCVALVAYGVALFSVARNRRGDPPISVGALAWVQRMFDRAPAAGAPFQSPGEAQSWLWWRCKGAAMPAIVVMGLVVGMAIWLIGGRDAQSLVQGFVVGGAMLWAAGLVGGIAMGNVGPSDANFEMGHFLATRPMTVADMARTILQSAAKSWLLAWGIWAAAFLLAYGAIWATPAAANLVVPEELRMWWYFPATFLGPWILIGGLTSLGLAGRSKLMTQLFCAAFAVVIGVMLLSKFALSREAQKQLTHAICLVLGAAMIAATIWAFAAAHRRKLIQSSTMCLAAGIGAAVGAAAVLGAPRPTSMPAYLLLVGAIALIFIPLAGAPLALSWNRHR